MRYYARVIAMLITSALMVGGPALAQEMDRVLPVYCVRPWMVQKWALVTFNCEQAAYDVLDAKEGTVNHIADLDGEGSGDAPLRTRIDFAYPAALALARSAYAYYALGSSTKAEALRQSAITLLSNADTSPESSSSFYRDGPKTLLADLKSDTFFQNRDILDGPTDL